MMEIRLKPYPTMKDSGLPWLGKIPEHWQLRRGKILFDPIDARSATGDEELLTVSSEKGVVRRSSTNVTMFKAESYIGYKLCWPGDLVINSLWAWARGLGVSRYHGIVSSAYGVYRLKAPYLEYPNYIHELTRSTPFQWELQIRSKGIWVSRLQLTDEAFLAAPFPLPPVAEQATIVRFMNHIDRRIRHYIRMKQELIKLLEEQKQAIINRAVTRGLGPNVRLKPSGVGWLGDVPENWRVLPIKRVFTSMLYGVSQSATDEGTIRLLTMAHIRNGKVLIPTDGGVTSVDPSLLLEKNDLLFNRTNSAELVGKVGLFEGSDEAVTFASYLVRMRARSDMSPEFLNLLLNDQSVLSRARREAIPSLHQSNLNPTRYGRLHVSVPDLTEQNAIVDHIALSTMGLRTVIDRTRDEIDLLREYKSRLLADVVTGKLDVREVAAQLPDESEEPESVDYTDAELNPDAESIDSTDETLETIEA